MCVCVCACVCACACAYTLACVYSGSLPHVPYIANLGLYDAHHIEDMGI